ncbi:cytochrome P450 [Meredithblackwellia eburnea MCA 4105]
MSKLIVWAGPPLLVPALVVSGLRHANALPQGWAVTILAYLTALRLYTMMVASLTHWRMKRRARRLGAQLITDVNGKLPGNVDILYEAQKRFFIETPGEFFRGLCQQHGTTIHLSILGGRHISTMDPAFVKHMLANPTGFANFEKGETLNAIFSDFLGSGIFNSDREIWKGHRSMARPFFARERISDFDVFSRHTDHLIKVLDTLTASNGTTSIHSAGAVDIQELFGRFTLDSATDFLMGGSISSLSEAEALESNPSGPSTDFLNAFNKAQENCNRRARFAGLWKLFELRGSANAAPMAVMSRVIDKLIEKALQRSRKVDDSGEETITLLDSLVQKTRDPQVLKDQVLNILLAARDTTMSTLTSSIYSLARDPAIMAELRAEVLANVPREGALSFEEVRGLKKLKAFVNEVLRLYPPVPFNIRASIGEDVFIDGNGVPRYIPASTRVSYSLLNIQRREDLWGKDSMKFDPNRWLDDRIEHYKTNPFIYTPFSAGARLCLGQQFAFNEVSFALIRLLQHYETFTLASDIQPADSQRGTDEVLLKAQITLGFTGGLWVRVKKAES